MPKTYSYRELLKALRKHDKRFFEKKAQGKGSHRTIHHPDVNGEPRQYTLKCHGEGDDIRNGHLPSIRRRFGLPNDIF